MTFGALPAFLVAVAADRIGRRRALLFAICAYTVLTAATALAPDARTFIALQFLARIFAVAELMLATVVVTERMRSISAEAVASTRRRWASSVR